MSIDVVVVAYKTDKVLQRCVDSLLRDSQAGNIYIVDNSPGHPVGVSPSSRISILEPGSNLGFGNGVNFAAKMMTTEYIAIVNPDLVFDRGVLGICSQYLDENPGVALVSPRVFVDGRLYRTSERDASIFRYLSYPIGLGKWLGVERSLGAHSETHITDAVNGAFMVARRDALDSVGWFDPEIFLFGEEVDLCRRLRSDGWNVAYLAEGHVDHLDGYSASKEPDAKIRSIRRNARVEQLRRARGARQAALYSAFLRVKS
ncbi:glycosyltransferase [Rhodococcus sp. NPDC060086]|uniref:glycosyltransferase n=1 Tax=Rhodococcus sp. NPDC060086 TaxID=3347055 RepID=UPI00365BFFE1